MVSLIPLIFIALIIWYFLHARKKPKRQMNKKWTYVFLATYAAILLIATIAVELVDTNSFTTQPRVGPDEHFDHVGIAIYEGDIGSIDPSTILEKRSHLIADTLAITAKSSTMDTMIIVERKSVNDGLIEETLIKPLLLIGDYDFSNKLNYKIPEWTTDSVNFPYPPLTEIRYTTYQEAYLLNQFVKVPRQRSNSYNTLVRPLAVHLLVPKDLIITADENLNINFVDK